MSKRWLEPAAVTVPKALSAAFPGKTRLAEALVRRGITDPALALAFLDPFCYKPCPASELPDLVVTAEGILAAIERGESIGVWGDFDVDGQTSTAILVSALRELGARVCYHIPVRARESHGVNIANLQPWLESGVQHVLTCDTGISAHEAVEFAHRHGLRFWITDHHSLPERLPDADACVNPQRLPEGHPLRTLSGAGVAYKLAEELFTRAGRPEAAEELLDLAALGLVADVATLTADTRWLVQRGLERLRLGLRPGLQVILEAATVDPGSLNEEHIGFLIGPRLNAVGRLDDANPMVEFLLATDTEAARPLALRMEQLNSERKGLCDRVFTEAEELLASQPYLLDLPALVLGGSDWHPGVVGIVASRLVDLYQRPVILLSMPTDGPARGSARSVPGIDITAAIAAQAGLLHGFGGHPMAAGLSLPPENLIPFRTALAETITQTAGAEWLAQPLEIDALLGLDEVRMELVYELNALAPFGPGNPPFLFAARNLYLKEAREIGASGDHLRVQVEDERGVKRWVVWWGGNGLPLPEGRFDLAFTLRANTFRGSTEAQMEWLDWQPVATALPPERTGPQMVDQRATLDLESLFRQWKAQPGTLIWREGDSVPLRETRARDALEACETLVVWTTPCSDRDWSAALAIAQPKTVILIAADPEWDTPQRFLQRLAALVRGMLPSGGAVDLNRLAAGTAQPVTAVTCGLNWLIAKGYIHVAAMTETGYRVQPGGTPQPERLPRFEKDLTIILQESAAYRAYFRRADPRRLADARPPHSA